MESRAVVEALIAEVKKRTCLWNKLDDNHKNRVHIDKTWDEIAEVMDKSKEQIKTKWRCLRDSFHREMKKIPSSEAGNPTPQQYSGKWVYFELLTFLIGHQTSTKIPTKSKTENEIDDDSLANDNDFSIVIEKEENSEKEVNFEDDDCLDPLEPYADTSDSELTAVVISKETSRKRQRSENANKTIISHVQSQIDSLNESTQAAVLEGRDVDDDVHFVLSLVPYLRKLDPLRKLIIRNEIQNVLIKELVSVSQEPAKGRSKSSQKFNN